MEYQKIVLEQVKVQASREIKVEGEVAKVEGEVAKVEAEKVRWENERQIAAIRELGRLGAPQHGSGEQASRVRV